MNLNLEKIQMFVETSLRRMAAVSYTHLDVYKRQTLYSEYLGKPVNNSEFSSKIKVLEKVFAGAEEFTSVGQLLGINVM